MWCVIISPAAAVVSSSCLSSVQAGGSRWSLVTHTAHNIKDSTEDSVENSVEDSTEDSSENSSEDSTEDSVEDTEDSIEDAEVGVQPQHHGWRSRWRRPLPLCPLPVLQPQLCPGALIAGASYLTFCVEIRYLNILPI